MKYADIRITENENVSSLLIADNGGVDEFKERDVDDLRQAQEKEKLRTMLSREGGEREGERQRTASSTSSAATDDYGMPTSLEPRLTFAIDPQLPPRQKKEFEAAGTVKVSSSPGMPTVSTVRFLFCFNFLFVYYYI